MHTNPAFLLEEHQENFVHKSKKPLLKESTQIWKNEKVNEFYTSLRIAKQTVCTMLIKGIFHCLIIDVYCTFYVLNHNCSLFPNCNNERHFGICLYWFPFNKALKTHTCIPLKLMANLNFWVHWCHWHLEKWQFIWARNCLVCWTDMSLWRELFKLKSLNNTQLPWLETHCTMASMVFMFLSE